MKKPDIDRNARVWANRRSAFKAVLLACGLALLPAGLFAAGPVVSKWGRFEHKFKSSVTYSNPLQEVTLTVVFTSPLKETRQVEGFWDGGKVWRVRFSPDLPGRWTYKTACTDGANSGLHERSGEFLCTSVIGEGRFEKHGPVRVARDHRHLEHADGTPFFWLADTVWNGARASRPEDWDLYSQVRAAQRFNVAVWAVAPGADAKGRSAVTGFADRISIDPEFFKALDAKVDTLREAGILSAIAPLAELESQKEPGLQLADDQAALLARYVAARWGAEPVAWVVAVDGDSKGTKVGRWKRIGQAAFGQAAHAPVVLYPGSTPWLLDEFRDEKWVDVFAFHALTDVTDDALKWAVAGPMANEWSREPARPLLMFTPIENAIGTQSNKRFSPADVRRAAYWGLLLMPSAGVTYGGQGVAAWDATAAPKSDESQGASLPLWQRSLFMPGAKQMAFLASLAQTLNFWQLRPQTALVAQPEGQAPGSFVASAETEAKDLALAYATEERTLDVELTALPTSPQARWFDPRTGQTSSAVGLVAGRLCRFPTPGPEDWLLLATGGRN